MALHPEFPRSPYSPLEPEHLWLPLVRYVRNQRMTAEEARSALSRAEIVMGANVQGVRHADALDGALRHRVSACDARFLVAAEALETKLVTEDVKLRNAAPGLTRSLSESITA